ncbi:MAG: FCD domain-containing protein [Pseudomonadota bacterium]
MQSIEPINVPTMTDALIDKLESLIANGVFKPGDKLPPERQMARDFEVSRATLRQALSVLESRGMLISKQGGGNFVLDWSKKRFTDPLESLVVRRHEFKLEIIELRQALESTAAFLAANRATDEDKRNIQEQLESLQRIMQRQNPVDEAKADLDLHIAIADAAHNTPLSLMLRNIYALLLSEVEDNLRLINRIDDNRKLLNDQHKRMVDCVVRGDGEGARKVVNEHLELIRNTFVENGLLDVDAKKVKAQNYFL